MSILPTWPPRDWRMLLALLLLAIAGGGAWLLSKWSLDYLVQLSVALGVVWPVAYYAYGALAILAITSAGFGIVLGFKSFAVDLPGDSGIKVEGNNS